MTRPLMLIALSGLALPAALSQARQTAEPALTPSNIDEATGRDKRVFPPHRDADLEHMTLELTIPDMNVPSMQGRETLRFRALGEEVSTLTLDARGLQVKAVTADSRKATFTHEGGKLRLTLDPPVPAGQASSVVIEYAVSDPPYGLTWTPESPAWPGRPAQLHTQGQPETNSFWFPCHDFPNEKLTTELIVTVPAGYEVSSNGHLVDRVKSIRTQEGPGGSTEMKPAETWHWLQDKPHVSYLVSLVVGKFDVVDVGTPALAMPVYAPVGRGGDVPGTFGHTKDMIEYFGTVLGEPYPWDRYAQLVVWNFASGGMENTSCTTLHDTAIISRDALVDHDFDGLIAHELAHQWFGDLATCNSWEHIWLNEGLATFMNTLWFEHRDGRDAYLAQLRGTFDGLIDGDKPDAPAAVGMVSKVYAHPWEVFRRPANPYGKGSSIAHMLREKLGDEVFFKGLHEYLERRKFKTAETIDLRQAMEDVSGESLELFFTQWCERPGVPKLNVEGAYDAGTGVYTLRVAQTQRIDADNPAFEFDLPVTVACEGGASARGVVHVTGRSGEGTIKLPGAPVYAAIDPNLSVLAGVTFEQSEAASRAMFASGPTIISRIAGARGLAKAGAVAVTVELRRAAEDKALPTPLRVEAVKALAGRGAMTDLRALLTASIDRWEVREAVVGAVADLPDKAEHKTDAELRENVIASLAERFGAEKSSRVRAASLRGLGRLKAPGQEGLFRRALGMDSQSDDIRQAAIDACVSYDTPWALDSVLVLSRPGHDGRTRAVATEAAGKLGHHAKDKCLEALTGLLSDRELRTRRAAGGALVALGDARGVDALNATTKDAPDEWRQQVTDWVKQLEAKATPKP